MNIQITKLLLSKLSRINDHISISHVLQYLKGTELLQLFFIWNIAIRLASNKSELFAALNLSCSISGNVTCFGTFTTNCYVGKNRPYTCTCMYILPKTNVIFLVYSNQLGFSFLLNDSLLVIVICFYIYKKNMEKERIVPYFWKQSNTCV